jgi:signal transduction histidine kinase
MPRLLRKVISIADPELSISTTPVFVMLAIVSFAVLFVGEDLTDIASRTQWEFVGLMILAWTAVGWRISSWNMLVSKWLIVVMLIALVFWLRFSSISLTGTLALFAIPTCLAAAMISLPAAIGTALSSATLLILLPRFLGINVGGAEVSLGLISTATAVFIMVNLFYHVSNKFEWLWEFSYRSRLLLEETRDRKAELNQALDDLARANIELNRVNVMTRHLRQAAEDARASKEEFVANVSHELRTPLNMILSFSEMIIQAPETYGNNVPAALMADLTVIERNANHLSKLVDDVLDLSQIDAGEMALTKQYVHFRELIEFAVTAVQPLYDLKGLTLGVSMPDDLPAIFCDRTRITEVLLNLLSNGGRFTEHGGVRILVSLKGHDVEVAVADTGSGIAAQDLSKLFRPFQQLDGSIRRRYGGTGLGLNISKRFIELHEGKIWVESQEGVGTTFYFSLPIAPPQPTHDNVLRRLNPDWQFLQRTHPSMAPKIPVPPRVVVLESGQVLQRLLTRYWHDAEIVPVSSIAQAREELGREPSRALLINESSIGKGLKRVNASTALPEGIPAIICSIPDVQQPPTVPGALENLIKPITRDKLFSALDRLDITQGTVLIVDDEPDILHLLARMLTASGRDYRILQARDGQEALDIMRGHQPDVILLDLIMPNVDGFHLLEMRSQDVRLRDIPVVVISALDREGHPVVSSAICVTRVGGLSARRLLTGITLLSSVFSMAGQSGDLARLEMPVE